MKKVISIMFFLSLFANDVNKYIDYSHKLFNYHFDLNLNIKPPFEVKRITKGKINNFYLSKRIDFELLSILNNSAYLEIKEYMGDKLIKKYKKWTKVGEKIGDCQIYKIYFNKIYFKCGNKDEIKTLDLKIPQIKEKQW